MCQNCEQSTDFLTVLKHSRGTSCFLLESPWSGKIPDGLRLQNSPSWSPPISHTTACICPLTQWFPTLHWSSCAIPASRWFLLTFSHRVVSCLIWFPKPLFWSLCLSPPTHSLASLPILTLVVRSPFRAKHHVVRDFALQLP